MKRLEGGRWREVAYSHLSQSGHVTKNHLGLDPQPMISHKTQILTGRNVQEADKSLSHSPALTSIPRLNPVIKALGLLPYSLC